MWDFVARSVGLDVYQVRIWPVMPMGLSVLIITPTSARGCYGARRL
jgi:hypothetical protein